MVDEILFFENRKELESMASKEELKHIDYKLKGNTIHWGCIIDKKLYDDKDGEPVINLPSYIEELECKLYADVFENKYYTITSFNNKTFVIQYIK